MPLEGRKAVFLKGSMRAIRVFARCRRRCPGPTLIDRPVICEDGGGATPNPDPLSSTLTRRGSQAGVGITLALDHDAHHLPVVTVLAPDMPAAASGRIAVGDRLVTVDEEPMQGHGMGCIHGLILGAAGSTVRLRLQRPAAEYEVELVLRPPTPVEVLSLHVLRAACFSRRPTNAPRSHAHAQTRTSYRQRPWRGWVRRASTAHPPPSIGCVCLLPGPPPCFLTLYSSNLNKSERRKYYEGSVPRHLFGCLLILCLVGIKLDILQGNN